MSEEIIEVTPADESPKEETVSRETVVKPEVNVNIDTENIAKKLDTIARRLDTIPEEPKSNEEKLNYFGGKDDKCIRGSDGHKLADHELYKIVLDKIDEKEKETGVKVPISHEFKQYMREYVKEVGGGLKTDTEFKREHLENDVDISRVDIDEKALKNI